MLSLLFLAIPGARSSVRARSSLRAVLRLERRCEETLALRRFAAKGGRLYKPGDTGFHAEMSRLFTIDEVPSSYPL